MQSKKIKILIVDDTPLTIKLLKRMSEKLGVSDIFTAQNGFEAIAVAVEKNPDIIFLDIEMPFLDNATPELDGIQTLKMLKAIDTTKNINVIMVSANLDHRNVATTLEYGAADCISKPFQIDTLNEKLEKLYPSVFRDSLDVAI